MNEEKKQTFFEQKLTNNIDENNFRTVNVDMNQNEILDEIDKEDALIPIEDIRTNDELELYLDSWEAFAGIDKETLAEAIIDDPEELDVFGQSVAFIVDQLNKLTDEERSGRDFSSIMSTYQNLLEVTDNKYHVTKYGNSGKSLSLKLPTLEEFIAAGELESFLQFLELIDPVTTDQLSEMIADNQTELIELDYATSEHYKSLIHDLPSHLASNYNFKTLNENLEIYQSFFKSLKKNKVIKHS